MNDRPETKYAWNGDVALAYQVFGDGPVDLVYCQGYTSNVDQNWASPYLARFLEGLGKLARVIHTDRRGWGCSDRFSPGDVAPLEVQVDDLLAVMDAAGSERAVIFASFDTVPAAILFAASSPERTAGLVLCDPYFAFYTDEASRQAWAEVNVRVRQEWGTPAWDHFGSTWDDHELLDWFVPWCRSGVAPGALAAESDAFGSVDVRDVLSSIHVPTLVVGLANVAADAQHDDTDQDATLAAERISGARLIQPEGNEIGPFHWYGQGPAILEAVGDLVASIREEQASFDRVLATVLFTDIVDSTATAATIGDAKWRALLEEHDKIAKGIIARFRGTYVRGTGDGLLATFDGPARGVRCAQALVEALKSLGIEIRAGLHTGEIEYGGHDLVGVGVNIGARVGAMAGTSEVWVSSTVKDLVVGSGLSFEDAGEHELKGAPDRWHLYRVVSAA
jgi:class 3 adenylate cyclase/pimeloyl-ACP methyl ester carboxylesterase